ncbi:NAD(P)H quinone oxidoreductase [Youhaiella tibetensis]|uniref:NAD(P)H-quinone oxidoreductase n=1 Tax=Paradevosia tibetensis TaxID=1447062 RepID=A0A5B9DRB6_9HYPH|nr:NAD(P)H-quinone oxidoreductase [Youhaiella tibetensis]QEE21970.1 NAD(P)H-quinone oxidoreductase [Youhaiella tibetensis]GGF46555.1 NAD(P)H quinone oxidoreductase [Youhaiella tibetensis]
MTLPDDMLAIDVRAPGGPDALAPTRAPLPELHPGHVLIRVAAAGINYPDVLQRMGQYDPPSWHSPRPGLEVAGEVVAVGEGALGHDLGAPVLALCNGGGYAEYVAVPAGQVLPIPVGLDTAWAGAIAETWFTVEQTLVMRSGLEAGMTVLVHGAAGGIGAAALAQSSIHGARPIAVVSTLEKADYVREELGVPDVIIHSEEDFVGRTKAMTDGRGADRIVTFAGGDMLARNIAAAARGGTIVQLASLSHANAEIAIPQLLGKQLAIFGSVLRPQSDGTKAAIAQSLRRHAWPAFASGRVARPRLRTMPLGQAAEAHRAMEDRASFGKIVLLTPFGERFSSDKSVAEP